MFVVVAHLTPHSSLAAKSETEAEIETEMEARDICTFHFCKVRDSSKREGSGEGGKVIRQLCINLTNLSTAPNDKRRLQEEQELKQRGRGGEVEKKWRYNREEWKRYKRADEEV